MNDRWNNWWNRCFEFGMKPVWLMKTMFDETGTLSPCMRRLGRTQACICYRYKYSEVARSTAQRSPNLNEWTDTSLRYRHWRMCFERLLQAFARWQPGNLFDIAVQPILEYRWIASYTQLSLRTQFKVATVYSIHTQSLSWCSTGLVPNVLPRRDEGSGKPCAVDRAS